MPTPLTIAPGTYARRRAAVLDRLEGGILVLRSNPEQTRSNDTDFPFRQDSDFHYLTGFDEPDSVLVLTRAHPEHKFVLFVRPRDPEKETTRGKLMQARRARKNSAAGRGTRQPVAPSSQFVTPASGSAERFPVRCNPAPKEEGELR